MPDGPPPTLIVLLAAVVAVALLSCDAQSEPAWTPAAALEAAAGSINWVEIAMNADGDAIAIWGSRVNRGLDARDYSVWAAPFMPRSGWGAATKLSSEGSRRGASEPAIAINDEGHAVAVWREWASDGEDPSGEGIWATRFDPETQWDDPVLLGQAGYSATVALNDLGQAVVAWIQSFDSVWVSRVEPASPWGAPVRLDRPCLPGEGPDNPFLDADDSFLDYPLPSQAKNPEIAMNDSGHAVVIWDDNENEAGALARCDERLSLRASHYAPDGGWSAATRIGVPSSVFGSLHAAVAVDESGRVLAGSQEGKVSTYTESVGWSSIALGVDDRFASVAMAESGHAVVLWEVSDPAQHPDAILAIRFSPDEGWGEPERFSGASQPSPADSLAPKSPTILDWASADVSVNETGDSLVVWHQVGLPTVRSSFDVWANHYTSGRGWSTPTALSVSETIEAVVPRVVMDSTGRGIAVWREAELTTESRDSARLMWSRFE